ncbi:MAG TPA: DUF6351 family protein [Kofleriaceae bacterium]|nr:DUF6351 family protein [Kofleriaceae bacterium]
MAAACGDSSRPNTPPQPDASAPQPDAPAPLPDAMQQQPPGVLQIKTLSNRADLVSGGDALVEIVVPPGSGTGALHVAAGDKDVSAGFAKRADGRTTGLIKDLADGPTVITADLGGMQGASLTITNHPIGGPVFSGPQVKPWICAVSLGRAPANADDPGAPDNGLSTSPAADDEQCNAATEIKTYYHTTNPTCTLQMPDPAPAKPGDPRPALPVTSCFQVYDQANPPTAAQIMTLTLDGATIPYIVRIERGTVNRGIYDLAVLCDPSKVDCASSDADKADWNPAAPPTPWNRKLLHVFGPATGQPRFQLRSSQLWIQQEEAIKRGYLVAVSSMTDSSLNSNRVSMTESLMMIKEHVIDTYGEVRYTVGAGCSGGSINQLTASSIYPGLLDGIQPSCTYPDSETTGVEVADCELLVRFYASPAWKDLMTAESQTAAQNNAKQAAINGHLDQIGCRSWFNSFIGVARPGNYHREQVSLADGTITAEAGTRNNCSLPASFIYDPVTKTDGIRCTGQDHAVSIWGLADAPGTPAHAVSTRDNVGIVYGHKALLGGAINPEEFVVLNEKIGGADFDIVHTDARSAADPKALDTAYKTGIVMDGKHLAKTPIIDVRGFDEQGIHYIWRSFALRARLDAAGGHGNHVLWRFPGSLTPSALSHLTVDSLVTMDKWLTTLKADTSGASLEQRVITDKPAEGFDFCYLSFDKQFTLKVTDKAICDLDPGLQGHSSPRQVAGGPVAENIFKCQLKPLNTADYPGLSDAQLDRLKLVFPDGVRDWTKLGVGQQPAISPLDFTGGPGGVALPAAPASKAN